MKQRLSHAVAALALLGPVAMTLPATVHAQSVAASPAVHGLQLRADTGLARGSQLHFTVQATPNSRAEVRINDTGIVVPLRQNGPGVYSGVYTVQPGDRIDANGLLRVSVISGPYSNTANYTFPPSFIAWQNNNQRPVQQAVARPDIDRFIARVDGSLEPGAQVRFTVHGAPGADASVNIPGVARDIALDEVRPGVYRGSYTVRRDDNENRFSGARAVLRQGSEVARADLSEPFLRGRAPTREMGSAPMTLQPMVLSHSDNDAVDSDGMTRVRGRTLPYANVRVHVDAVPPLIGQRLGVAHAVITETVQADANGNFSFGFNSRALPFPGTRYEVSMTADNGSRSAESRITLVNRG